MFRSLICFIIGIIAIVFSQSKVNMPFDYSKHQGYVINEGAMLWNQDWSSGPFFFDGSFENYPSKFGPQIEAEYFSPNIDSTVDDSNSVSSYFDYVQGDYFLDNLDIGLKFINKNNKIILNGFKRKYAGAYNQYTAVSEAISPIQYTYTGIYSAKINNDHITAAIGSFNSDYSLFDTLSNSFVNSDIISSNIIYKHNDENNSYIINSNSFLQKYYSSFPEIPDNNIRFLNRTKNSGLFNRAYGNLFFSFLVESNKRTYRSNIFKSVEWSVIKIGVNTNRLSFSSGASKLNNDLKIIYDGFFSYEVFDMLLSLKFSRNVNPSHISLLDTTFLEIKDKASLSGKWSKNKISARLNIFYNKYNPLPDLNHGLYLNSGSSLWISSDINVKFSQNTNMLFGLDKMYSNNFITDGVNDRARIEIQNKFGLFSKSMKVNTSLNFSGLFNRQTEYVLHPTEQFPVKINHDQSLNNILLLDFFISAQIKNIQIKYDMYNLANIIYDYLGKNDQDFNYQLSPYFPELRRLTSLSINWIFRD